VELVDDDNEEDEELSATCWLLTKIVFSFLHVMSKKIGKNISTSMQYV
jgi:hypothetical protein